MEIIQGQEQQQHSQSHKHIQQRGESVQLQHQQGISSTIHLSQPMAHAPGDSQGQHEPSLSKSIATKQELIVPVLSPEIPQQTTSEPLKSTEPILLDERALLGCLVRAVPEEASNKIRISSTVSICLFYKNLVRVYYLYVSVFRMFYRYSGC